MCFFSESQKNVWTTFSQLISDRDSHFLEPFCSSMKYYSCLLLCHLDIKMHEKEKYIIPKVILNYLLQYLLIIKCIGPLQCPPFYSNIFFMITFSKHFDWCIIYLFVFVEMIYYDNTHPLLILLKDHLIETLIHHLIN